MVIPRFINQAMSNCNTINVYGEGIQTRDFTYIDDCIKVFHLLKKKVNGFHILNSSRKRFKYIGIGKKDKKRFKF